MRHESDFLFFSCPWFFPPIYFICINFVFYVMSSKRYCYILVSVSVSYMECFLLFLTFCLTISSSHSCSTISLQHMSKPCQTCLSKFICDLLCLHHPLCCAFTISPPHMAKPSKPWLSFFITKLLNLSCRCEILLIPVSLTENRSILNLVTSVSCLQKLMYLWRCLIRGRNNNFCCCQVLLKAKIPPEVLLKMNSICSQNISCVLLV